MGGMEGIKRERSEQQSDRAEDHHQNGFDLGRFEVQKVMFLIQSAFCLYLELCFLQQRGVHFQKINEKSGQRVKNGARRPYMASVMGIRTGLLGPKNEEVDFHWF